MQDNLTPEEKLLRLIRGEKKKRPLQDPKEIQPVAAQMAPVSLIKHEISKERFKVPAFKFQVKYLTVFSLKNIILTLIICSSLYLVFSFIYSFFGLKIIRLPKINADVQVLEDVDLKAKTRPLADYLQSVQKRKIFENINQPGDSATTVATSEILKNLSLVGIISGDNPQAIIEDKNQQKTYYLTKGQSIADFQVVDIKESNIILNYNGQKYELNI